MTARVISLCRFRALRARAERQARTLRAEGRTLLLGDARLTLGPMTARRLAEDISDALDGKTPAPRGLLAIRHDGPGFLFDCWDLRATALRVTRGQLAAIGVEMVRGEVKRG